MSKLKDSKNIIIAALLIAILIMSVGYAQFTSNLQVTGTTEVAGIWKVKIKSMTIKDKTSELTATDAQVTSVTDTVATFANKLYKPGDFVTFEVTVENEGNIPAYLDSLNITGNDGNIIIYPVLPSITGEGAISRDLAAGATLTFDVKVQYNPDSTAEDLPDEGVSSTLTIGLNYVQKA